MVNSEDFIKRLETLMEHFGMNASSFADKIGVQRSSISHLLSGRNKPSLDFVMKILDLFPEVDLYWILNGKGNLLKEEIRPADKFQYDAISGDTPIPSEFSKEETENTSGVETEKEIRTQSNPNPDSEIVKIVFFYKDGTFKDFNP